MYFFLNIEEGDAILFIALNFIPNYKMASRFCEYFFFFYVVWKENNLFVFSLFDNYGDI